VQLDEYLQLVRRIGAEPAISLRLQWGSSDEIESALALLEYVNGNAHSTPMGRLRAARGHAHPYGVKKFYLGNEAGCQPRLTERRPNATRDARYDMDGPPSAADYAAMLRRVVPRLMRIDPTLQLIATTGTPNITWPLMWYPKAKPAWEHKLGMVPQVRAEPLAIVFVEHTNMPHNALPCCDFVAETRGVALPVAHISDSLWACCMHHTCPTA
jgi:alpha-L-arabinofuranosidase